MPKEKKSRLHEPSDHWEGYGTQSLYYCTENFLRTLCKALYGGGPCFDEYGHRWNWCVDILSLQVDQQPSHLLPHCQDGSGEVFYFCWTPWTAWRHWIRSFCVLLRPMFTINFFFCRWNYSLKKVVRDFGKKAIYNLFFLLGSLCSRQISCPLLVKLFASFPRQILEWFCPTES